MSKNPYHRAAEKMSVPRQYAFVKFNSQDFAATPQMPPFSLKHRYIFLGEIPNMGGHCIVMDDNGKPYAGFHTENFVELTDDELNEFPPVGYKYK